MCALMIILTRLIVSVCQHALSPHVCGLEFILVIRCFLSHVFCAPRLYCVRRYHLSTQNLMVGLLTFTVGAISVFNDVTWCCHELNEDVC